MEAMAAWTAVEWIMAVATAASVVSAVYMGTRGAPSMPSMPSASINTSLTGNGPAFAPPSIPTYSSVSAAGATAGSGQTNTAANSPTYGWGDIHNTSHSGAPPPLVYGLHRVGGLVLNVYKETVGNTQALNMLIAIGEGEITAISGIEINKNPITNYHDISYETRLGLNDQTPIPYFGDIVTEYTQNAKLTTGGFIYPTRSSGVQAVVIFVEFPSGLYAVDGKDDAINYIADLAQENINLGAQSAAQNDQLLRINADLLRLQNDSIFASQRIIAYENDKLANLREQASGAPISRGDYPDGTNGYISWRAAVDAWNKAMDGAIAGDDAAIIYWHQDEAETAEAMHNLQTQAATINQEVASIGGQSRSISQQQLNTQRTLNQNQFISRSVVWRVEYRRKDGGAWTLTPDQTTVAANKSAVRSSVRIDGLAAGQYDFRVSRVTPESVSFRIIDDMFLTSVDEIVYDDLAYPNTALLGIRAIATDQLNGGIPNVTCVVMGKKIAVWDGVNWSTAWSNNPVWVIYDLLTNSRYGLGSYVAPAQIDLPSFLEAAQWCDSPVSDNAGGFEKRCEWDGVIDTNPAAWDLLNQIGSTFGGSIMYTGGVYKITVSKPAVPVQLFTMGNIIADSFSGSCLASDKNVNAVDVQFSDKNQNWAMDLIPIETQAAWINNEPIRKQSISLFGVTRRSQAEREAHRALNVARLINRRITFSVGVDALACDVGDVFSFSHDVPLWGQSGRVLRGMGRKVQLDRPVEMIGGKSYALRLRHNASDTIEEIALVLAIGISDWVTAAADWAELVSSGDLYSFGEIGKDTKPFRIHSIGRASDLTRKIDAWEYNPDVWVYDNVVGETPNLSSLPNPFIPPPPVADLVLSERLYVGPDGVVGAALDVWFNRPAEYTTNSTYDHAEISVSTDFGASWKVGGNAIDKHFVIAPVIEGMTYIVAVVAVGVRGVKLSLATAPRAEILIHGKTTPPSAPTNFAGIQQGGNVALSWTAAPELDVSGYAIREGVTWNAGLPVSNFVTGNSLNVPVSVNSTYRYWIKTFDTTGHYSGAVGVQVVVSGLAYNAILAREEMTLHDGAGVDFVYISEVGGLINPSALTFADIPTRTFQDAALAGLGMGGLASHSYASTVYDQGRVASSNVTVRLSLSATDPAESFNSFPSRTFQTYPNDTFSSVTDDYSTLLEINLSDDNTSWGGWQAMTNGSYSFRYIKWRLTVTASITARVLVSSMIEIVDVPDIRLWVAGFAVGIGGTTLTFATYGQAFFAAPKILVTPVSAAFALPVISAKGISSVFITCYDAAGVSIAGTVDALMEGW